MRVCAHARTAMQIRSADTPMAARQGGAMPGLGVPRRASCAATKSTVLSLLAFSLWSPSRAARLSARGTHVICSQARTRALIQRAKPLNMHSDPGPSHAQDVEDPGSKECCHGEPTLLDSDRFAETVTDSVTMGATGTSQRDKTRGELAFQDESSTPRGVQGHEECKCSR